MRHTKPERTALERLLDDVDRFSEGARRAFDEGDQVAGIALITTAAQLLKIARAMETWS